MQRTKIRNASDLEHSNRTVDQTIAANKTVETSNKKTRKIKDTQKNSKRSIWERSISFQKHHFVQLVVLVRLQARTLKTKHISVKKAIVLPSIYIHYPYLNFNKYKIRYFISYI